MFFLITNLYLKLSIKTDLFCKINQMKQEKENEPLIFP